MGHLTSPRPRRRSRLFLNKENFCYRILYNGFYELTQSVIAYKKVYVRRKDNSLLNAVVTLEIPRGASVYLTYDKCRASSAIVKKIEVCGEKTNYRKAYSVYNRSFQYQVGKKVKPDRAFSHLTMECQSGIHFFRTKAEAENY